MEQYVHHLSGHIQELRSQEKVIKEMMGEDDLRLLAVHMKDSGESYALKQADYLVYFVDRKEGFEKAYKALTEASIWGMPFYFLRYFDTEIGGEAVETFNFGLPFTWSGIVYLVFGGVIGLINWMGLVHLFRKQPEPEEIGV